jgi:hypothetical protein
MDIQEKLMKRGAHGVHYRGFVACFVLYVGGLCHVRREFDVGDKREEW